MQNDHQNPKRVFVIGGSRGIGRAAVLRLTAGGTRCVIGYVANDEAAKDTAAAAAKLGPEPALVKGDQGRDGRRMVEQATNVLGGLDGLMTTAVPYLTGRVMDVTEAHYREAFDVHVWGFLEAVRAGVNELAAAHGSVVAVTSLGAWSYARYYGVLGPAKAAMEALVRYLAAELGPRGVRVNAVSPCLVDDPGHGAGVLIAGVDEIRTAVRTRTPLRRLSVPDEVASAAVALMSGAFGFVTGQIIKVDGGYSLLA